MNTISENLVEEIKKPMLAKDTVALNALRALKTALTNASIAKGNLHAELDDNETIAVVRKQIKQRVDAAEQYRAANREDLSSKEEAEIKVLSAFLPAEMSEDEVKAVLEQVVAELGAAGKQDMGRVMKAMQERTDGRAPGKLLAQLVGARLA